MSQNSAANSAVTWSPNFIVEGLTAIVWGTEGINGVVVSSPNTSTGLPGGPVNPAGATFGVQSGNVNGWIVTTCTQSQRVEEIDIEQGSGFEAIVILLKKGYEIEATVIDDLTVVAPVIGSIVTFSSRYGSINMLYVGDKTDQARKREGMRTVNLKSFNAISGLN